jgi:predicted nucleic acid-binding protein
VNKRPAVNASPLIFLARAGLIDLLKLAGTPVVVPAPVAGEILSRGPHDPAAQVIERSSWIIVVEPPPIPEIIMAWDLGKGESSVLAWAYMNPGTEAILDDLAGRRCAATLGIRVRGTLGLVLTAKKRGKIAAARPIVERLRHSGMYLSDRVVDEALTLVDE